MSTGPAWVDSPIPVFLHGGPTACHPTPIGMAPNGYYQETGYMTAAVSWAPGRPTSEEGCDDCADVVKKAAAAASQCETAGQRSKLLLEDVARAAAADLDSPLQREIAAYADAESGRARCDHRQAQLDAEVAEQDRRWRSRSGTGASRPDIPLRMPAEPVIEAVCKNARRRARARAEEERQHQRPVNRNRDRYGSDEALAAKHARLKAIGTRPRPALPPRLLVVLAAAGAAAAVALERAHDWMPAIIDALRYSEDVRERLSLPTGVVAGALAFGLMSLLFGVVHRARAARAARAGSVVVRRMGCGEMSCTRCPRPASFSASPSSDPSRVGGWLVIGSIALAAYAGVAVGDPLVKLQRVAATVPESIRDDCRARPIDRRPIELRCAGPRVSGIGLSRVFFQFGNPSYDTYGKGIFEQASFRSCPEGRTEPGRTGAFAECGPRSAVWTDEAVVLGGAIGRRAAAFARLQHRHGGARVY